MNGRIRLVSIAASIALVLILLLALSIPSIAASGNGSYTLALPVVVQQECPPGLFFFPPANACIIVAP